MTTLLERAKKGLIWNAAFNVFRDMLGLVVMLVLVRLLDPAQYGEFTLVTAVIGFVSVFSHQNFLEHTLQVRDERDVHYQYHFTAGGLIQLAMFVITNFVAIGLRFVDNYSEIAPLVHVMSIGFLLEWPCELRLKMLERSLDWRRLRLLHAAGLIASSIVAISMGLLGAGVYALLLPGLLVTLPFIFDLFVLQRWRPTWEWDREQYMPAVRFGLMRLSSGLIGRSRRLIESGVVVFVLGFSSAGLLERAISLGLMFCQRIALQIMYTLYPVMTKLKPGTDEYRRAGRILIQGITWFTIPVATLLAILAAPVVHTVYGGRWDDVVPLVPVAVIIGGIAAVFHITYMLLLCHNEERRCVNADLWELCGTLAALYILLPSGLMEYLVGLLVVRIAVLSYGIFWLIRCGAIRREALSKALFPAIAASGFGYLVCGGAVAMTGWSVQNPPMAIAYGVVFLILYIVALRVVFSDALFDLVKYLPGNKLLGRFLLVSGSPA